MDKFALKCPECHDLYFGTRARYKFNGWVPSTLVKCMNPNCGYEFDADNYIPTANCIPPVDSSTELEDE